MKKIICFLVLFSIVGLINVSAECADRYLWLTSTSKVTYFLDTQTFNRRVDNNWAYLDVWVKQEYNFDGVQEEIKGREKHNLPTAGYENLDHELLHEVFAYNRQNRIMISVGKIITYDKQGNVIDTTDDTYSPFTDIIPNSIGEDEARAIAAYVASTIK